MEVLVRPTGFEPAAYRVGVIRPSRKKARFYVLKEEPETKGESYAFTRGAAYYGGGEGKC